MGTDPTVLKEADEPYTVEAQKRRPKKRSDDYYWQLYFDYRDKAQRDFDNDELDLSSASLLPRTSAGSTGSEEPPHPADMPEYAANHASTNGNGYECAQWQRPFCSFEWGRCFRSCLNQSRPRGVR